MSFITQDLNLAVTLITVGHKVQNIITVGEKKREFEFSNENNWLDYDISKYWENELVVDPKKLLENYKDLKSKMWSS